MKIPKALFVYALFAVSNVNAQQQIIKVSVPPGGNSFVTAKAIDGAEAVTDSGWINWQHKEAVFSTYVYLSKPGTFSLAVVAAVPGGQSKIACTINGITKSFTVTTRKAYPIGEWQIRQAGYIKIDMQGIAKKGIVFAAVDSFFISGTAVNENAAFVKNNEGNYFYWGRRGPSVHLNYDLTKIKTDVEWFYNEITVPKDNDVTGSYFMANGFAEGYFGMQVNSDTERRVLFSVWSPFNTDDPGQIPDDKKIRLLQKGEGVHTGEFGNEGSGGQSYLQYNWQAGVAYKFLVHAQPVENNYTNYSAYFYAAEKNKWLLIASFSRPATHTYLTRLHSFLENFEPETGCITRKALYQNQWVKTVDGEWIPVSNAAFTYDATAKKGYRLDYKGNGEAAGFLLQNCGFFNEHTALQTIFSHPVAAEPPVVDVSLLR